MQLTKWMTWITAPVTNAVSGLRRLTSMVFSHETFGLFRFSRSKFDFEGAVGDGTGSSTVMAPLLWMARTFPESPPALWKIPATGDDERVRDHPMLRLMERPNEYHTGITLWMATLVDWLVNGDAYWFKIRSASGKVVQLWWLPSWMVMPRARRSEVPDLPPDPLDPIPSVATYIAGYTYTVNGTPFWLEREDIVHFRYGLDPQDVRHGLTPLKSVLREIFTDDEAALFTATLLRNMGVPGILVSPDTDVGISEEDALETKADIAAKFTGDSRGEAIVMTARTKVEQFGFSPEQLVLKDIRRIPEERVSAVLGVPAIVAGLGAGLDRSTFTNFGEARAAAYESGIIPNQRILAEDVRWQLLSEFESDPFLWRFGFDLSRVRVLQEDQYRSVQRHNIAVNGGWEMVSEARRAAGLEVDDARDEVFLRPANVNIVPAARFTTNSTVPPRGAPQNGAAEIAKEVVSALERERLMES